MGGLEVQGLKGVQGFGVEASFLGALEVEGGCHVLWIPVLFVTSVARMYTYMSRVGPNLCDRVSIWRTSPKPHTSMPKPTTCRQTPHMQSPGDDDHEDLRDAFQAAQVQ